jgi:hypothetical protein
MRFDVQGMCVMTFYQNRHTTRDLLARQVWQFSGHWLIGTSPPKASYASMVSCQWQAQVTTEVLEDRGLLSIPANIESPASCCARNAPLIANHYVPTTHNLHLHIDIPPV